MIRTRLLEKIISPKGVNCSGRKVYFAPPLRISIDFLRRYFSVWCHLLNYYKYDAGLKVGLYANVDDGSYAGVAQLVMVLALILLICALNKRPFAR